MHTLAEAAYLDSSFDETIELPHAGSALENPYVFDATARELKVFADRGLVQILAEQTVRLANEELIGRLLFRRLR